MDENIKKQLDKIIGDPAKDMENLKADKDLIKKREEKPEPKKPTDIALKEDGSIDTKTVSEQYRAASIWIQSGMLPSSYNTPQKVITGIQYARELGLSGITALKQIAVIKGAPSIFGDLPLTLAMKSNKIKEIEEYWFDKKFDKISLENKNINTEVYGAYCRVKTNITEKEATFTLDDAKKAGLIPAKADAAWTKYPRVMLKYRARTENLKDTVPTALNGLDVLEYNQNMTVDTIDVSVENQEGRAKELFDA